MDPAIARLANQLVSDWMRPILRRSKAFVDREVDQGDGEGGHARFGSSTSDAAAKAAQANMVEGGAAAGGQRRARIPQAMTATFSVAPRSNLTGSGATNSTGGGVASQARMREYKKKIQMGQQAARRV